MLRTRYDGFKKAYVSVHQTDTIMPAGKTELAKAPNFINGAPFGPYDDTKPVGQLTKAKGDSKE